MRNQKPILIIACAFLLLTFFLCPFLRAEEDKPEETIPDILQKIRIEMGREITGSSHDSRMNQWVQMKFQGDTLLDRLLNKVDQVHMTTKGKDFPGKDPFLALDQKKWKSFRFLLEYRKFLYDTVKQIERGKFSSFAALQETVKTKARYFRGKAGIGSYQDLDQIFNIQEHSNKLYDAVKDATANEQVKTALNAEIQDTINPFLELKTITNDLKKLKYQFKRIKLYYEGNPIMPELINAPPPENYKPEKPSGPVETPDEPEESPRPAPTGDDWDDTPPKPTPKPAPTGDDWDEGPQKPSPAPAPTGDDWDEPSPGQGEKKLTFEFYVETAPAKVGDSTILKAENIQGGTPPYKYNWTVNDKTVSTNQAIRMHFKKPGKYVIRVEASDKKGAKYSLQKTYIISDPSKSSVKQPPKDSGSGKMDAEFSWSDGFPTAGREVIFKVVNVTGGKKPYRIKWFVNGKGAGTAGETKYKFPSPGKYSVKVQIEDAGGLKVSKAREFQAAEKDLSFKFSWEPEKPAAGERVKYYITNLEGGVPPYKYRWVLEGKSVGSGKEGELTFPEGASAGLTVTVTDSRGQIKSGSRDITAGLAPLDYKFWWSRANPIAGQPVRFGVKELKGGEPPYTIEWKIDGESVGKGEEIKYVFKKAGKYKLMVEVRDSGGKAATGDKEFTVRTKPDR